MSDEKDEHPQAARIREREEIEAEDQRAAAGGTPAKHNQAG